MAPLPPPRPPPPPPQHFLLLFFFLLSIFPLITSQQSDPNAPRGPLCAANRTIYPCRSYAFYRAAAPPMGFLDLASIGDLFGVTRISIARASNISDPASPLYPGQPLLVPLTCSCNQNRSSHAVAFKIRKGDTFWGISTYLFQNLTDYQDVELLNPSLVPTNLDIGVEAQFPVFCQCPDSNSSAVLITYSVQTADTVASIASSFGASPQAVAALNAHKLARWSTAFVPVPGVPISLAAFTQGQQNRSTEANSPPPVASPVGTDKKHRDRAVIALGVVVGVLGALVLALLALLVLQLRRSWGRDRELEGGRTLGASGKERGGRQFSATDTGLMSDIYECLDKYRVFQIDELRRATSNFDSKCLIQGTVYKGWIEGQSYAIKRMRWNAMEELRILQKVNHTNLVKLEGFCIDPEDGTCYLVYEYVENGSLHSWLHDSPKSKKKLDWRTRLRIAIDVANGLQYIHEHTFPRVVHKDIRTSNVLLDGKMRAKIANFGLARSGCNAMTTHIVGTQGYVAPEYLADGIVTTKMDVFAYGVVLLELVSGKEAVTESGQSLWSEIDLVFGGGEVKADERLAAWLDRALAEHSCPVDSVVIVMKVAKACLQRDPSKRPTMVDVVYTLSKADDLFSDFSGEDTVDFSGGLVAR